MAKELISVRVDETTKDQVELLFKDLGLTTSGAINIFLKQCLRDGKIPFEISRGKPIGRKEKPLHKPK